MGLRTPDGKLGIFSVVATYLLGIVGLIGLGSLLLAFALDSDFWSDRDSDKVSGAAFFAVMLLGAIGFVIMERSPWGGAALGVLGGLSMALVLWWTLLGLVLGLGCAAVAVMRERALTHRPVHSPGQPA
ncbi:MAG TPA: hypothetical protein VM688_06305 [Nocardioidaceae bacterium]|nr:hypothetical protein [Nocardioidaceae bacterium]